MTAAHRRSLTAVTLAALTVVAVSACGSDTTPPPPATASPSTASPSPSASPSSRVSPTGRPVSCVDPVGDGSQVGDLTSVDVVAGADAVRVTWRTTVDVAVLAASPSTALFGLDLTAPGPDGRGVTFLSRGKDGVFDRSFGYRTGEAEVDALGPATVDGTTLTVAFPDDLLQGLPETWTINGSLALGALTDECRG